jgi:hypothetical protein
MIITQSDICKFVTDVLGYTMFMLGDYSDQIIDNRYVSLSVKTDLGYTIFIKDFETGKIIYMDLDVNDPEYIIQEHKLNMRTRLYKYYDLFGDFHLRKVGNKK